jgi:hypothetical protein
MKAKAPKIALTSALTIQKWEAVLSNVEGLGIAPRFADVTRGRRNASNKGSVASGGSRRRDAGDEAATWTWLRLGLLEIEADGLAALDIIFQTRQPWVSLAPFGM